MTAAAPIPGDGSVAREVTGRSGRGHRPGPEAALLMILLLVLPAASSGQEIPRDRYLRFLPLQHRHLRAATPASRSLHLFGDRSHPGYRDVAPRDGIDDRRGRRLRALAARFAPFLVRNTPMVPLSFEAFAAGPDRFPLRVDRWHLTRPGGRLVSSRSIELGPYRDAADDRALGDLVRRYDPSGGDWGGQPAVEPASGRFFEVLFLDFPGGSPDEWKDHFFSPVSGGLTRRYRDDLRVYVHPFLQRVEGAAAPRDGDRGTKGRGGTSPARYELVLQYWFFYPFNDGGNNHEGDWEHLNVVVAMEGRSSAVLNAVDVRRVLGPPVEGSADPLPLSALRIGRVDYYFHGKVMTLDYLTPDVYRPRREWRRAVERRGEERLGEAWFRERVRERAYADEDETRVNTHPVAYIGADNKGLDQLLAAPGGKNRDSHGTFPFPGLYKDVGPAGAAEAISGGLNPHRKALDPDHEAPDRLVRYDDPGRIRIVPDWERVRPLALEETETRRAWSWLFLPVRWGWPAVRSPFAGTVAHAETGNDAPYGPAFNPGWNRTGETRKQGSYHPHRFAGTLPVGWKDGFVNSWGFMNLTLPTLSILPPFDFGWRVLAAPARAPFQSRHPTFFPGDAPPFRLVGGTAGVSISFLPDNFTLLLGQPEIFDQIQAFIDETDPASVIEKEEASTTPGFTAGVEFHVGNRLVSQNRIRRVNGSVSFDIRQPVAGTSVPVEADFEMWEYAGSLRYNLSTQSFQPFVKAGYGLSWFRVRNATLGGEPLDPGGIDYLRQPSFFPPENLLPNTFHAGAGLEFLPVRNFGPFPAGLDLGFRASFSLFFHGLGVDETETGLSDQEDVTITRPHLDLGAEVSF